MKGRLIALDHVGSLEAAALIIDGRVEDLFIDRPDLPAPGTVLWARVDRQLKGQGGVMVSWPASIGGGKGFLRKAKGLAPGDIIRVQTTGFAEPGKAIPVTDRVLYKSRYAIVTPAAPGLNISRSIKDDDQRDRLTGLARAGMEGAEAGLILRSASVLGTDDDILEDIATMRDVCDAVTEAAEEPGIILQGDSPHTRAWREWVEPAQVETANGSFEAYGVLDALDALDSIDVALGAHSMAIEPTRALVAVDVNTGADTSPSAPLKANLAAIADLPRQLRLRGLGGQVTIDFAPLLKRDRRQIETSLRAAFRRDPVETEVIGWTPLGHMELKRKRERRPLAEVLA